MAGRLLLTALARTLRRRRGWSPASPRSHAIFEGQLQLSPDESSPFIGSQYLTYIQTYSIIEPVAKARRLYILGPKRTGGPPMPPGPSGPAAALFNTFALDSNPVPGDYRLKVAGDRKTWELTNVTTSDKERGAVGDSVGNAKFHFNWTPTIEPRWAGETFDFRVLTLR